jgi:hypothetical protein
VLAAATGQISNVSLARKKRKPVFVIWSIKIETYFKAHLNRGCKKYCDKFTFQPLKFLKHE